MNISQKEQYGYSRSELNLFFWVEELLFSAISHLILVQTWCSLVWFGTDTYMRNHTVQLKTMF